MTDPEGGACRAAALDSGLRRWGRRLGGYRCRSLCGNGPRVPIEAASARHSGEGRNPGCGGWGGAAFVERHCVCGSGGAQPVVAATGSGAVPAERPRWIPACAGMTDPAAVPAERLRWIPACAGMTDRGRGACRAVALESGLRRMTDPEAVPAERLHWIPACAGMTDPEAVPAERLRWIPACAGMTDPEAVPAERLRWIPACAGGVVAGGYPCPGACAATDRGCRSRLHPSSFRRRPESRMRRLGWPAFVERHCVCWRRAGAASSPRQDLARCLLSGCIWIPACAGMTDRGAVPAERLRWSPACAGMTDPEAVPAERLHWSPACAGGVVAWVGTDVGACAATDRGCRSRLHPLVIPAKAGIQDAEVGVALRLLSGTVHATRAGCNQSSPRQDLARCLPSGCAGFPACAGMTDPGCLLSWLASGLRRNWIPVSCRRAWRWGFAGAPSCGAGDHAGAPACR